MTEHKGQPLRVKWEIFDPFAYHTASESYPEASPEDFTEHYEGEVVATTQGGLFSCPKFVVMLDDGKITNIPTDKCTVVE